MFHEIWSIRFDKTTIYRNLHVFLGFWCWQKAIRYEKNMFSGNTGMGVLQECACKPWFLGVVYPMYEQMFQAKWVYHVFFGCTKWTKCTNMNEWLMRWICMIVCWSNDIGQPSKFWAAHDPWDPCPRKYENKSAWLDPSCLSNGAKEGVQLLMFSMFSVHVVHVWFQMLGWWTKQWWQDWQGLFASSLDAIGVAISAQKYIRRIRLFFWIWKTRCKDTSWIP